MRWYRTAVSRLLLFVGVALIISSLVATYYGVQLGTSYSTAVPSSQVGAAVAVVMPTTSQGVATLRVTGASQVLYLSLQANPIALLPQVRGLGLKVVTLSTDEDFRAGVMIEVAGLQGNPIFVEEAFQNAVKYSKPVDGVYTVRSYVNSSSYLVVVAVPSNSSSNVGVSVNYRVTGYGRLSNLGAVTGAVVLVAASLAYDLLRRAA